MFYSWLLPRANRYRRRSPRHCKPTDSTWFVSPPQELRAHCEGPPEQPSARREPGVGPAQVQRLSEHHGLSVPVLQQLGVGGQLPGAVGLRVQLDRGALQAAGRRGHWCIVGESLVRRGSTAVLGKTWAGCSPFFHEISEEAIVHDALKKCRAETSEWPSEYFMYESYAMQRDLEFVSATSCW